MHRIKTPCCSKCKNCYQLPDARNRLFRFPVLLNCGHDVCKICLKYMFKTKEPIICEVCQDHTIIEDENELQNFPTHYYLIGKMWCIHFSKKKELNYNISKLGMTVTPERFLELNENKCFKCHNLGIGFCQDCNVAYCGHCFDEVHIATEMYYHKLTNIHDTYSTFQQQFKCDKHLKQLDYICIPCKVQLCLDCVSKDHQNQISTDSVVHSVVSLHTYNSYQLPRLNELTTKGNNLLQNLTSSRNVLYTDMLKYQNKLKKKNGDLNVIKQEIANFITSISGSLQNTEQTLINFLSKAEQSVLDSMTNVLNNLNGIVIDLQEKVTKVEQFITHNQNSCEIILDPILTIEKLLDTNLYVAKKNKIEPVIACNSGVFDAIQQCVVLEIGNYYSDTYILTDLSNVPPDYTCASSADYMTYQHERPSSSMSSISTGSSSISTSFIEPTISQPLVKQPLDYSTIKEVKQKQIESVIVTHINSPSDFYLQLVDNIGVLNMITYEMNRFVEAEAQKFGSIEMSNVLYAVLASDHKWYRGVVVDMKMELNKMMYTVHCVDYGFLESFTSNQIYRAPESIVSIPPLAVNCTLYSLKPSSTTGWSNTAINDFNCLILEKKGIYFMYPVNTHGEMIEVDIVWCNDIYPLSIRDAMFCLNHGSSDVLTNVEVHEKLLKIITLPKPDKLQKGASYQIHATHFISPSEFYFRIRDDITDKNFKNMMNVLQSKYKPTEVDTLTSYLLYSPQIGMAVAARYSLDKDWYRAKIISLPETRMVTVFYVDYGNSETLPWHQLRVLDQGLVQMKPLAIKACVADIKPAEQGIECNKWTEDAFKAFVDLLQSYNNVDNTTAYVLSVDGEDGEDDDDDDDDDDDSTHYVVVYNRWSRGEFCVNRLLVNQGFASAQNLESIVFKKPSGRKPVTITEKTNIRDLSLILNRKTIMPTEDFFTFNLERPVIASENHIWTPTSNKYKDVPGVKMLFHKVNSPDDVVLKYNDLNIANLTERMNTIYEANKKTLTKSNNWKEKDLCAMFIQKYGNWYRGKILKINTTKNTASIFLYDLDEIHNKVLLNVLYNLDKSVVHDKCGFLHCSMHNIIPSSGSDGEWAQFICDRLTEILHKYRIVFFSKLGKKDDQIFGEIWVKDIAKPSALEVACDRWININQYMIEQGFAINEKQYKQVMKKSTSSSESELDTSFENSNHCWLPPNPLDPDKNLFNVIPLYVDMQCNVYFRTTDNDTEQLFQEVAENLNLEFSNSNPEPINFKWTLGQMVIVQYHLDNNWYRGTIIDIMDNDEFEVQFLDYGNIEICTHKDLRSTLYMTDVRQLCVKGFLSSISPVTKDKKWTEADLDCLHTLIVEKPCTVVIDFEKSTDNNYAITRMKNTAAETLLESDICQYMVTLKKAYFLYMDGYNVNLVPKVDNSINLNSNKNTMSKEFYEDCKYYSNVENCYKTEEGSFSLKSGTNIVEEYLEDENNQSIKEINDDINAEYMYCTLEIEQDSDYEENMNMIDIKMNKHEKEGLIHNNKSRGAYLGKEDVCDTNNRSRAALIQEVNNLNNCMINYDEQNIENIIFDNIDNNEEESNELSKTFLKIDNDDLTLALTDKMSSTQSTTCVKIDNAVDTEQISHNVSITSNLKDTQSEYSNKNGNMPNANCIKIKLSVFSDLKDENVTKTTSLRYSKMSLKYNDAIEACLCEVMAPTRLMLVIEKIGGVDMADRKTEMNNKLMNFMKHSCTPELDIILSGTPVVVEHNYLWKRGVIVDGGQSVFLVDSGIYIKLMKKNLRQCPIEFIEQPMFSIDCQLINVTKELNVTSEDVMRKLTKVLTGVSLRVVEVEKFDNDVIGVELFNDKKEIAYQSLIDCGMLIRK